MLNAFAAERFQQDFSACHFHDCLLLFALPRRRGG
jgi:hypothetical protein